MQVLFARGGSARLLGDCKARPDYRAGLCACMERGRCYGGFMNNGASGEMTAGEETVSARIWALNLRLKNPCKFPVVYREGGFRSPTGCAGMATA